MTDRAQRFVMRRGHPRVEWHRRLLRTGLRVAGGPVGTALSRVGLFDPAPPTTVALPDYPHAAGAAA